jgi:protoporphyrinogen IX oxidase
MSSKYWADYVGRHRESSVMMAETTKRWIRPIAGIAIVAAMAGGLAMLHPSGLYLWFKAVHVMAVIAWMAGMLYLPRLFVYHCEAEPGSRQSETFKIMEGRLLRGIINPAMVVTWALGLWMAWDSGALWAPWLQLKLLLVVALSAVHGLLVRFTRDFAADRNRHSQRFYRIINEIPAVLMIGIVILVVIKPF